jgi:predicted double-glycine peptidase
MTMEELEKLVGEGIPVIVDGQAWRDDKDKEKPWTDVWESGHYMVVIGFDKENVYFEDPSLFGSRGVMTREEFNDRWHDTKAPYHSTKKQQEYTITWA